MAKTEQIVTDRKTMREIIEFMEDAMKEGFTKDEIMSQIDLMLDKEAQNRVIQSETDVLKRRVKRFKTAKALLADLHSPN